MKRLFAALLALLLCCAGCVRPIEELRTAEESVPVQEAEETVEAPSDAPEQPQPMELPKPVLIDTFILGEILDDEQTEGVLTVYDLDGDGRKEQIGFSLDWDEEKTVITDGDRSYVYAESPMLTQVLLADMDTATPWRNLIVIIDTGSDDYVTIALHPEEDALIEDNIVDGFAAYEDGRLLVEERTGLFGTNSGKRAYCGDDFQPVSEWLDCEVPSEESMLEDPQDLIDGGVLLHLVRDLTIALDDGSAHVIHAGTYICLVRFHESRTLAEVSEMDGVIRGVVTFAYDPDTYTYTIDGVAQDEYFDNLFYAD